MNYLITPVLYNGSSFVDIFNGLIASARKRGIGIELLPVKYSELCTAGLDNPKEYAEDCLRIVKQLIEVLNDNDRILFLDAFFPGLDILEYALRGSNIHVNKIGLLHGSSFIPSDVYANEAWLKPFEMGWYGILDHIVCPSRYFCDHLPKELQAKILILPWGLDTCILPQFYDKKIDVIFPHRFAPDKGIDDLLYIIKAMPDVHFCITGVGLESNYQSFPAVYNVLQGVKEQLNVSFRNMEPEEQHLATLQSSKILLSTAKQEGFGYAAFKAVQCGCIPVLPDRCCYPEFFPSEYLYNNINDAISMIYNHLKQYPKGYYAVSPTDFSFDPILNLLT